jgi:hypothetical protein
MGYALNNRNPPSVKLMVGAEKMIPKEFTQVTPPSSNLPPLTHGTHTNAHTVGLFGLHKQEEGNSTTISD